MAFFSTIVGRVIASRTVWGVTLLAAIPVLQAISPMVPAGTKLGAALGIVLGILTIWARIKARQPLGPVIDATIAKTVEAIHIIGATAETPAPSEAKTTIANPESSTGRLLQMLQIKNLVKAME